MYNGKTTSRPVVPTGRPVAWNTKGSVIGRPRDKHVNDVMSPMPTKCFSFCNSARLYSLPTINTSSSLASKTYLELNTHHGQHLFSGAFLPAVVWALCQLD